MLYKGRNLSLFLESGGCQWTLKALMTDNSLTMQTPFVTAWPDDLLNTQDASWPVALSLTHQTPLGSCSDTHYWSKCPSMPAWQIYWVSKILCFLPVSGEWQRHCPGNKGTRSPVLLQPWIKHLGLGIPLLWWNTSPIAQLYLREKALDHLLTSKNCARVRSSHNGSKYAR